MSGGTRETGGTGKPWTAEEARKAWAELLNLAQWQGEHVTITRSNKRAAMLVPPDWYDRAKAALAAQDATSPAKAPTKRQ